MNYIGRPRFTPPLCLRCGETDALRFRPDNRARCIDCRRLCQRERMRADRQRTVLDPYAHLPQCRVCDLRDSHVVNGVCPLCVREGVAA